MGLDASALEKQTKRWIITMIKRISMFVLGFIVMIVGMALVMRQWSSVVIVFQGIGAPLLAVGGLVLLFASTLNKND